MVLVGGWGFFLWWCFGFLSSHISSVTVVPEKIKAVHSPRQKPCLHIYVALLQKGSAASAKLAVANL